MLNLFKSRMVMFTLSSCWVAFLLVIFVFRGGGAVPVERRPDAVGARPVLNPAARAGELVERGDYEGAWRLYDEAIAAAPENVSLWYGLGVALSHLNQRKETEEAFRFVVDRGVPDSLEVRLARQWLISAGVLAPSVTFTSTPGPAAETPGGKAVVQGKVAWGPADAPLKGRVLLQGESGLAGGKRFIARVSLGGAYRFEGLAAGSYRLIGVIGDQHLWNRTVDVEDGQQVTLDLTRDNSSAPNVVLAARS